MPEKTLQEDEPSRQSNLTLLSSGLRDRVESLITSLDTVTVDVVSEYQNIKTDVHNEQPDLNLDSLLPREKLAILAKFNRPYENARPHHQYLAGTAWQLDQSSFVTRFGEAAYLNLRILKLLRALSKEDSDFDHIHAQLQEQRGHRLTGALKTRGVRKHIDWQPWEFEQVLQRYRERTDSRTQARSCNPAASKAPVLRSGHDANRDELPPLQDHSSHEVQPVDSPQAQPRSVPRLSSAVQVRRSNDVCTTQVVRGTKRKRFHESGPEESTGRAPKHKVGPEEAEEEALQTPDSPSEDLTSPSIELGRRERVDFKPPESPFLPSDDQLSDLSLPEPASSPFVLIDDCDHSDHVQTSVHDIRPEVGGIEPMLSTMQGQTRLNDECIYTALLAFRPQQPGWVIAHSTTLCVSDLASQAIRNNSRIISTKTYAYDLLIPIFWPISQHWTLGHFDLGRKIATHFDSLTSSQRCIKASSVLSAFLSSLCQDVTGWQFYNSSCPQQTNDYDCGIFVLLFAMCLMHSLPMPHTLDPVVIRSAFLSLYGSTERYDPATECATTPILSEASHAFAEQLTSHDVERLGPVQQSAKATIQSLMATAATASIIREIIVASIELQSQRQYLRDIETTQKSAERCKGNSQTFLEALEAERTRVAYCVGNVVEGHLEWPFSAQHCALALENLDATLRHTSMGIQKLQTFMADLTQKRQQKLRENRGAIARMEAANRKLEDLAPA